MKQRRIIVIWRSLLAAVCLMAIFSQNLPVLAESLSDLKNKKDFYTAQAEKARQLAEAKQNEANQLKQQIDKVSNQIDQTEKALDTTANQIDQTGKNIDDLVGQVKIQEDNLAKENERMKQIVSTWYMEGGDDGLLFTLINSQNLSEVVDQQQYYSSIRQQISATQDQITAVKTELESKKTEKEQQLQMLTGLKNDQESQRRSLEQNKNYKDRLLNNTTEAISDLKVQEQQAQQRAQEVDAKIKALTATRAWGDQIISQNDGGWYYMQTGNYTHLGNSPYTVSQYGCLITSMAMVATYYGRSISPSTIASNTGIFDRNGYLMVNTPPGIGIVVEPSQPVNWGVVNSELESGHPVIVSIYLPSVGGVNSDGSSHFIVLKGRSGAKYLMHDPIGDGRGYNISQVRSMKLVRPL